MKSFGNMTLRAKLNLIFAVVALIFAGFAATALLVTQTEIIIGAAVLALILILVMLNILMHYVANPAETLAKSAKNLADGDLKIMMRHESDDELGQLSDCLFLAADSLSKLREANHMIEYKMRRREFGTMMPTDSFLGEYKEAANLTNSIISIYEEELANMAACMEKFAAGEFSANIGYGQKSRHIAAAAAMARSLDMFSADMQNMMASAAAGDFTQRLDAEKYKGNWKKQAHNVNGLMEALAAPIEQARAAMDAVAAGKLDVKVTTDAKGELLKLKVSTNNATTALAKYVKSIIYILENIDKKSRYSAELPQDFAPIKAAAAKLGEDLTKKVSAPGGTQTAFVRQRTAFETTSPSVNANFTRHFSGAPKIADLEANSKEVPVYMRPDFGKY